MNMNSNLSSTYKIIDKIGSGGGGNVYLAEHLRLGKKVVLKIDKRKVTTRPELLRREVDILKELSHSYIPQVYDFFIEEDNVYTVMDYIEGESLDKPLKRGETFTQAQVIKWAKQLLEALQYLHSPTHGEPPRGYVHSDIKPANIMRKSNNEICLIDFNIALALGEENIVGRSAGYASPEHYGLDYSLVSGVDTVGDTSTETIGDFDSTLTIAQQTETITISELQSKTSYKKIKPDVRSDIYSLGATLYHLLGGVRPAKDALEVVPLSKKKFSPQLVDIIAKAMNPNPELRYQTAEEMLYAFSHLHKNDPRMKKFQVKQRIGYSVLAVCLCVGAFTTFTGLKRMQAIENGLKLAEYSKNALEKGDVDAAIQYALDAIPDKTGLFTPERVPEAEYALAEALGIYKLGDGFQKDKIIELSSNPLNLVISPNGETAAALCDGSIVMIDTQTAKIIAERKAVDSALAEVEYLNDDVLIYAGENGIESYSISKNQTLWTGEKATAISISKNRESVAAVYKDESQAVVYEALTGKQKYAIDFKGKKQNISMVSDNFANTYVNLFEINSDGSKLAVSFADGSLMLYNLANMESSLELLDKSSGYTHYKGGFFEQYLALSAANTEKTIFAVVDSEKNSQTIGFESDSMLNVRTDENGIYLQQNNALVKIDPISGEQTALAATDETIEQFCIGDDYTAVAIADKIQFFDKNLNLVTELENTDHNSMIQMGGSKVLSAHIDLPMIHIVEYKENVETDIINYSVSNIHDEARISADKSTVMLFSYKNLSIYDMQGKLLAEVKMPDLEEVYDQQFRREDGKSYLEVTYKDGRLLTYDAKNGELISETQTERPDMSAYEEFYTEEYKIEAPLHGIPTVYNKKTGEKVCELKEDAYLTYITETEQHIVAQYITAEGESYGILLDENCNKIARLPYLCDVMDNELYFDYPAGNIRKSVIYSTKELVEMAQTR